MQANLVIESKDTGGKKLTSTITHIRPSEKGKATELATALNALTTNTYVGAKVNELNIDLTGKPEPTLTLGTWNYTSGTAVATITYNGDGQLFCNCNELARINGDSLTVNSGTFTGTLYATEGTNYASKTLEFSR